MRIQRRTGQTDDVDELKRDRVLGEQGGFEKRRLTMGNSKLKIFPGLGEHTNH